MRRLTRAAALRRRCCLFLLLLLHACSDQSDLTNELASAYVVLST